MHADAWWLGWWLRPRMRRPPAACLMPPLLGPPAVPLPAGVQGDDAPRWARRLSTNAGVHANAGWAGPPALRRSVHAPDAHCVAAPAAPWAQRICLPSTGWRAKGGGLLAAAAAGPCVLRQRHAAARPAAGLPPAAPAAAHHWAGAAGAMRATPEHDHALPVTGRGCMSRHEARGKTLGRARCRRHAGGAAGMLRKSIWPPRAPAALSSYTPFTVELRSVPSPIRGSRAAPGSNPSAPGLLRAERCPQHAHKCNQPAGKSRRAASCRTTGVCCSSPQLLKALLPHAEPAWGVQPPPCLGSSAAPPPLPDRPGGAGPLSSSSALLLLLQKAHWPWWGASLGSMSS